MHYEVGDHEVLEQDSEMEPYHLCDASKVNVACEEALSVKEDGFAHADVAATSVEVHELLQEDLETHSHKIFEEAEWYGKIYELRRGPGRVQIEIFGSPTKTRRKDCISMVRAREMELAFDWHPTNN